MSLTDIEWVKGPDGSQGFTLNSKTGCLTGCPYCYARRLANGRLKQRYLANANISLEGEYTKEHPEFLSRLKDPFYPRFWPERLKELRKQKKPAGFFLDDMSDWMAPWWPDEWTKAELQMIRDCPQHRFYTLTKWPQNLIKFSPFPENCWVGVTATDKLMYANALKYLGNIGAAVHFLSFEPLLKWDDCLPKADGGIMLDHQIDWLIIGAMTFRGGINGIYPQLIPMPYGKRDTLQPKLEWVEEIVEAADKAGIPVFLKDNLFSPLKLWRQEMPKVG
jgi:protein gp37